MSIQQYANDATGIDIQAEGLIQNKVDVIANLWLLLFFPIVKVLIVIDVFLFSN